METTTKNTDGEINLPKLRQLLTDLFNASELKTICFDLDIDYENLEGQGKANKARELIGHLRRNGRLPELLTLCASERPNASWDFSTQTTHKSTNVGYSTFINKGLDALAELMQNPQVHNAIITFHTDFQTTREQIILLSNYKQLHDLLHTLQFHCYDPILQEARRFPADETTIDNLMDHELTLQQIISSVEHILQSTSQFSAENTWIEDINKAKDTLAQALQELDKKQLRKVIWRLNRVLSIQPSLINTRLNAAARALRLPSLIAAMTRISDHLAQLELNTEEVSQFETGVDNLMTMNLSLSQLVNEHDEWQYIDVELRRIEANEDDMALELEMSWEELKSRTEPFQLGSNDQWARSFKRDTDNLQTAINAEDTHLIKRYFRRYRRQAGLRFHKIDLYLKGLCENLREVDEPLNAIMRRM